MYMRPYRGWGLGWREMDRLRREVDRLFRDWPRTGGWTDAPSFPAMNMWADENKAVVTAELPGISTDDLDISVQDDTLTLRGSRRLQDLEEGARYHRRERRFGSFARTLRLPFQVNAAEVDAAFRKGVLSIALPRAEADKPRRITVKSG